MYGKYGLYESIDFTPERLGKDKKHEPVKTYMAHHQGLILLSINNLLNKNIKIIKNIIMQNIGNITYSAKSHKSNFIYSFSFLIFF